MSEGLNYYEREVLNLPPREPMEVPERVAESMAERDYYRSLGLFSGQVADYRRRLEDGSGLHLKEYPDGWTIHWDEVDPSEDLVGHLRRDAAGVVAVGVVVGLLILAAKA